MSRAMMLSIVLLTVIVSAAGGQQLNVSITAPPDNTTVPERPFIEGKVTDSSATVWVIVHPMEVSDYWIQPSITVRKDGKWRLQVYIGRPGSIDVGKHFQIMAVANPKLRLKEGDILKEWPEAKAKSQVIGVIRK